VLEDQGEVFDTLMGLRHDRHVKDTKLMGLNEVLTMAALYILDKLTEIADSSHLQDKIKVVFSRVSIEDESFIGLMHDLYSDLRLSLTKNQRLIAELEALGQRGDALKPLEYMREMVARDFVMLGVLE
nr:hypothetical protein [Tanacetum cinerariifolium]